MHPEPENTAIKHKTARLLTDAVFYFAILFFIIGFNFSDRMAGNWYQQFMPLPTGGQIRDIYFVDSLLGFAVSDSSIIKTVNGGDNWSVKQTGYYIFNRIKFLNVNTGFASGGNNTLLKTINSGENWSPIILPSIYPFDMSVISEDSIWLVNTNGLTGGVFRTTNGGASWQQQINLGSQNPSKIYMFNGSIGFFSSTAGLHKTTNSGVNWINVSNDFSFSDMFFIDSLTGWKASGFMKKTTNGGINWINQPLPSGGNIIVTSIEKFSNVNKDTIWGVSGYSNTGSGARGMIYRTTNAGDNWLYQIPDSTINIFRYFHNKFVKKNNGWAYNPVTGIHTTTGGDPVWVTPITQISSEVPKNYKLHQNYPNPFNPVTKIKYDVKSRQGGTSSQMSNVKLIIYDIEGKVTAVLVDEKQNPGIYEATFNGSNYSSGVYFYSMMIDGKLIDTKKMILIK